MIHDCRFYCTGSFQSGSAVVRTTACKGPVKSGDTEAVKLRMLLQLLALLFVQRAFQEPLRRPPAPPPHLGPATWPRHNPRALAIGCLSRLLHAYAEAEVGECLTLGGLLPYMRLFVDPWLHKTGAWFVFILNFRNAFTMNAINFAVPVITSRDYGWTQLHNSYVFVALSLESIISTAILQRASKRFNDRNLMSTWALISHTGLLAYAGLSSFGVSSLPVATFISSLVWYDFGSSMPPTQSLYSKLIGKARAFQL